MDLHRRRGGVNVYNQALILLSLFHHEEQTLTLTQQRQGNLLTWTEGNYGYWIAHLPRRTGDKPRPAPAQHFTVYRLKRATPFHTASGYCAAHHFPGDKLIILPQKQVCLSTSSSRHLQYLFQKDTKETEISWRYVWPSLYQQGQNLLGFHYGEALVYSYRFILSKLTHYAHNPLSRNTLSNNTNVNNNIIPGTWQPCGSSASGS